MSRPSRSTTLDSSLPTPRESIVQYQRRLFQELLRKVWNQSAFYREFYVSHGIRKEELADVTIRDLPFLAKPLLMENFDRAVTDTRLRKQDLEQWLDRVRDPKQLFHGDFIAMHSSGSSGTSGTFVYSRTDWQVMNGTMAPRLPQPENLQAGKSRAAFYFAAHDHFAGVATVVQLPKSVYETLIVSPLDSEALVIERLQRFQPHRLTGYSSSIARLAELAIEGKLRIRPKSVVVSGELLTTGMEQRIREAWGVPVYNLYGASESLALALKSPAEEEMAVMDDLNALEILDEENQPVEADEEGRTVVTNLYNHTLPILRYELGDTVVRGRETSESRFSTLREIRPGKANDALPVVLDSGERDAISPRVTTAFYAAGLERVQFISQQDRIRIDYVARQDIDGEVGKEFQRILDLKGASRMAFSVRHVPSIAPDPQTGKARLVKMEQEPIHGAPAPGGELEISFATSTAIAAESQDKTLYKVVQNRREQYSIWPADRDTPSGWKEIGKVGSKDDCVAHIKEVRTEIKPSQTYPEGGCIHQLVEAQAMRSPHHVAVVFENQELTYDELNARANQLAHHLRTLGVGPETLVAISVPRSLDMAVGILGILKAGGAWLPLDPTHPKDRQQRVFQDARPPVLLTQESMTGELPEHGVKTVFLDSDWASIGQHSKSDPENVSTPTSLAYVMYTSGSTGHPKGVMITHANLSHYVRTMRQTLGITTKDVYLHTATMAFSSSVRQLMVPLAHGTKVIVATADGIQQPLALLDLVKQRKVTILDMVPSYWRTCIHVLTSLDTRTRRNLLDNDLRLIAVTGESLLPDLPRKWRLQFEDDATLVNMFGQTETTGTVTTYSIPPGDDQETKTVPIGGPIADTQIYLLDARLSLVPIGTEGEIYVGGPGLGRGYLNHPELTAERFVPNPFSNKMGDALYKTGDMARYRADGNMEFLSRIDDQVQIRGIRIETGEIEAALAEHPGIEEIAVMAREAEPDNKRLVAYLVPKRQQSFTPGELRSFLKQKLPEYMIPAAFVPLEALPLTPSGKVNRRALLESGRASPTSNGPFTEPRNPLEETLTEIWSDALGFRVGIHDNFFDLGGHSLLATQILSSMTTTLKAEITLREFFEAPTVAHMAEVICRNEAKKVQSEKLGAMLTELESLSEEEADRQLKDRSK